MSLQLKALKDQIRQSAEARDAELLSAKEPLVAQIRELEDKATSAKRVESMLRAARKSASKADGQIQAGSVPELHTTCNQARCLLSLMAELYVMVMCKLHTVGTP